MKNALLCARGEGKNKRRATPKTGPEIFPSAPLFRSPFCFGTRVRQRPGFQIRRNDSCFGRDDNDTVLHHKTCYCIVQINVYVYKDCGGRQSAD